jgi:hypothetical protein
MMAAAAAEAALAAAAAALLASAAAAAATAASPAARAAIALCVLLALLLARRGRVALGSPPPPAGVPLGPGALPLLGHGLAVVRHRRRFLHWLAKVSAAHPGGWALSLPLQPLYIVTTQPAHVGHVLRANFEGYEKGPPMRQRLGALLGGGIFVADGATWHWQRKAAAAIFSVAAFRRYVSHVFAEKAARLEARLAPAAASGQPVDVAAALFAFTLDAFCAAAFGADPGALDGGGSGGAIGGAAPFAAAFDAAQAIADSRFWWPAWRLVEAVTGRGAFSIPTAAPAGAGLSLAAPDFEGPLIACLIAWTPAAAARPSRHALFFPSPAA